MDHNKIEECLSEVKRAYAILGDKIGRLEAALLTDTGKCDCDPDAYLGRELFGLDISTAEYSRCRTLYEKGIDRYDGAQQHGKY